MESLFWHLTNRTAETLLIFNLFHLLLIGLAVLVLLHLQVNRGIAGRPERLLTFGFGIVGLHFALLTLWFGAAFFLREQITVTGLERVSHGVLTCGVLVMAAGYLDAAGRRLTAFALPSFTLLVGLVAFDTIRMLPASSEAQPLHTGPMLLADVLAVAALLLAIHASAKARPVLPGRGMRVAGLGSLVVVFALHLVAAAAPSHHLLFWNVQEHLLTVALFAFTWAVGERSRELLDRVFVRLNLTFLVLASLVMLITAGMEKYQYFRLAEQRSTNLAEFLRGHVLYFRSEGESIEQAFDHPEVLRRVITEFGNLPELREVNVYVDGKRAGFRYTPEWEIKETIGVETAAPPGPELRNSFLMIQLPIAPSSRDRIELIGTLDYVNDYIGKYIVLIYSSFTVMLGLGVLIIGMIVADTDRQLRRRYAELQEAQQQLAHSAKLASIGELAGGLAHEINNPITSILALASHMADGRETERLSQRSRRNLHLIVSQTERVAELVRGLLTFSRQTRMHIGEVELRRVLNSALDLLNYKLKDAGIVVRREIPPALPPLRGDVSRLTEVFVNLIANAIDAMPRGGTLLLRASVLAGEVRIEVQDTGVGIPVSDLPRVFDPFFTTKEPGRGTGLGLSISHGIIKDHGGQIWARSEAGRGTTMIVTLEAKAEYETAHSCG